MLTLLVMRHLWALVFLVACADPEADPLHRLGECDNSWADGPQSRPALCEAVCMTRPTNLELIRCKIVDEPRTVFGECTSTFEIDGVRGCCMSEITYGGERGDVHFYECL